jgi:hypothetical protein
MDMIKKTIPYPKDFFLPSFLSKKEELLFFDIETTGLSPKSSQIYSIGILLFKDSEMEIVQLFANSLSEEIEVLQGFQEYCKGKSLLISFNGKVFDTPFLEKSYSQYGLKSPLTDLPQLDLFKMIQSRKKFYQLPSYKLKECERFLGIQREDVYTGGELVYVYLEYLEHPTEEAKALLLQHNFEDLLYLPSLFSFFAYEELFQGKGRYCREKSELLSEENKLRLFFHFTKPAFPSETKENTFRTEAQEYSHNSLEEKNTFFPKAISHRYEGFQLEVSGQEAVLEIPLFSGEAKYFFKNFKDYDYIPAKDMALHKSLSQLYPKEEKQRAKAATAYQKKTGLFLPVFSDNFPNLFQKEYKEKQNYIPFAPELLENASLMEEYFLAFLLHFF